ncbi:hypothetical protein PWT90_07835 [Aphanocladium album]|nr:hypothetical protein PWT90_07835 [Aphanocladium album]
MGGLLAVAGVVTPLGLYDSFAIASPVKAKFVYTGDKSLFALGTIRRNDINWSRVCASPLWLLPCPFTSGFVDYEFDGKGGMTVTSSVLDTTLPETIVDTYSSGTNGTTTVSNFFDIRWRRLAENSRDSLDNGTHYPVGSFNGLQSLVLSNSIELREGLIIDLQRGGIGFRNHTVPLGFQHGVFWEEDLLFVEPETVCVDTNLTLDFVISNANGSSISSAVLTDRGGFVHLDYTQPFIKHGNRQAEPNLHRHAYVAAWYHNAFTAMYFNVTNPTTNTTPLFQYRTSVMNQSFDLKYQSYMLEKFQTFSLSSIFGNYLDLDINAYTNTTMRGGSKNVHNIQRDNFTVITCSSGRICQGYEIYRSPANITNILTGCGVMRGVPQRQDGGDPLVFDTGSRWSQKLYACASNVKATIKAVAFSYNRTDGHFETLIARTVDDKQYYDNNSVPVWGVEDTGNRYAVGEIGLVWGLVSPQYEGKVNVSTVRQPSLYLPAHGSMISALMYTSQNLPGSDFSSGALARVYCPLDCEGWDYSGVQNLDMWVRWQNLTASAEKASLIPNLIFTDIAASAVTGSRGALGPGNVGEHARAHIAVRPSVRVIRYHMAYGVPAFLMLLMLLAVAIGLFVVTSFGHSSGVSGIRRHMQTLSVGRIYTTLLNRLQDRCESNMHMPEKQWNLVFGKQKIDVSAGFPILLRESPTAAGSNGVKGRPLQKVTRLDQ